MRTDFPQNRFQPSPFFSSTTGTLHVPDSELVTVRETKGVGPRGCWEPGCGRKGARSTLARLRRRAHRRGGPLGAGLKLSKVEDNCVRAVRTLRLPSERQPGGPGGGGGGAPSDPPRRSEVVLVSAPAHNLGVRVSARPQARGASSAAVQQSGSAPEDQAPPQTPASEAPSFQGHRSPAAGMPTALHLMRSAGASSPPGHLSGGRGRGGGPY